MKTYLIAGGAGFIGSNLTKKLLAEGHKVIVIDNLITGAEQNIEEHHGDSNFVFINQDIVKGIHGVNQKIDGIFHLASPASPNAKSPKSYIAYPIETLMVNSLGTKHLLDLALQHKARLVFASTSEIYGDPEQSPQKETYFGNVNPNGIRSVYDEGKRFGEAICMAYARSFNANICIIRIFNTYGPLMQKDDGRVVSNFITQALNGEDITIFGDGEQTRSFCFVSDLIDGFIRAMEMEDIKSAVINLGNDDEHTINEIADKVLEMTDSQSKIVHEELPQDDPKIRRPDLTRAKQLLGYSPRVSLDEGLLKTIEYFKSNS